MNQNKTSNALAAISFNEEQVALIRSQVAPKASPEEFALFLYAARRTGLDPLTRQIYCIHRRTRDGNTWKDKMTIQTGIDGFRVIAQRTGQYAGQSEPVFTDLDGKLAKAVVKVYKFRDKERYEASVGVAYWDEYVPIDSEGKIPAMWKKMPHAMLAKVAEALALRKAFPQDLSSIYVDEEMQQADTHVIDEEIEIKGTLEELHDRFLAKLSEYEELVGMELAKPYHPDNWKGHKDEKAYTYAIDAIENRINEYKSRVNA